MKNQNLDLLIKCSTEVLKVHNHLTFQTSNLRNTESLMDKSIIIPKY